MAFGEPYEYILTPPHEAGSRRKLVVVVVVVGFLCLHPLF